MQPDLLEIQFDVPERYHGWRLDHFIQARIPRLSRSRIQKMIRAQEGHGTGTARPADRVRAGQQIRLLRPAPDEPDVPRHFDVLYQDEAILAIDKPAGLPVHTTARYIRNTLTALLRDMFPEQVPTLGHRLDRETSGIMLLARHRGADAGLKRLFEARQVAKRYLAIVEGALPWATGEGMIDLPIAADLDSGIRIRRAIQADGLPARTVVRRIAERGGHTLVEALPETGRQHQIRIHLSAIGCPIVGDKLYGPDPFLMLEYLETGWTPALAERLKLPRHALHAATISFVHPTTKRQMKIDAPLAADLTRYWDALPDAT